MSLISGSIWNGKLEVPSGVLVPQTQGNLKGRIIVAIPYSRRRDEDLIGVRKDLMSWFDRIWYWLEQFFGLAKEIQDTQGFTWVINTESAHGYLMKKGVWLFNKESTVHNVFKALNGLLPKQEEKVLESHYIKTPSTWERNYPPVSEAEAIMSPLHRTYKARHSFADGEIELVIAKTSDQSEIKKVAGQSIIMQRGIHGSAVACAAMLITDHGKQVNQSNLRDYNLKDARLIEKEISDAGLLCCGSYNFRFDELKSLISKNGPAIISVDSGVRNHTIILDKFSDDFRSVIIRDPYHGWQVLIRAAALKEALEYAQEQASKNGSMTYAIQIQSN